METLERIVAARQRVAAWRRAGSTVALVPTMGNLHDGHLSLVRLGRARADHVVVSIFVNPMQFGTGEDFERYPRTLERDCALLAAAGVDLAFTPAAAEIYPAGPAASAVVDVPGLSGILEGRTRPGHFAGVATVVTKLFNIVAPDVAVFGQKDFQQLTLIGQLVRDLCLPIDIVPGPTVRDDDGLALSSRNQYLSAEERRRAPALHAALAVARARVADGDRDWAAIEAGACKALRRAGFVPDYIAVRRVHDLLEPAADDRELVVLGAARLGQTRLIDNVRVTRGG